MAVSAADLKVSFAAVGVEGVSRALSDVGSKVDGVGKKAAAGSAALFGVGAAITAGFAAATRSALSFEASMGNVNSIAQLGNQEIAALSDQVLRLAGPTAQAPQVLADGLYEIYSSGFQGAEGLSILENSAYAATAGLTTTDVAARAVTSVLNAFGLEASEDQRILDMMFQTVNDGVITFPQLANNMGSVLPVAAALGIELDNVFAAYAQLTLQGIGPSQAETYIAGFMKSALNPTEQLTAAIGAAGYTSAEMLIQAEGVPGLLKAIEIGAGGSGEKLYDMLGTQEAVNAYLALGGENLGDYTAEIVKMGTASDGAGAVQEALAKQMETSAFKIQQAKIAAQQAAILIGGLFTPAIGKLAQGVTKLITGFTKLDPGLRRVLTLGLSGVAAIAGLAGAIGLLAAGTGPVAVGLGAIGAAFAVLLSPIGLVAAAIVGLGIVFRGPILDGLSAAGDALGDFFGIFRDSFDALRGSGASDVMDQINAWGGIASDAGEGVGVLNAAIRAFGDALTSITGVDASAWFFEFAGAVDSLVASVADFDVAGIVSSLGQLANLSLDAVISIGSVVWGGVTAAIGDLYDWIKAQLFPADQVATVTTGDVIVKVAGLVWGGLVNAIGSVWDWIKTSIMGVGAVAGDGTGGPQPNGGADTITLAAVTVKLGGLIWGGVAGLAGDLWGWVKSYLLGGNANAAVGDGTGGPMFDRQAGIDLPAVLVKLGGLLWDGITGIPDLTAWVRGKVMGTEDSVGLRVELGQWYVDVAEPILSGWRENIREWVKGKLFGGGGGEEMGMGRTGTDVGLGTFKLGNWTLDLPKPGMSVQPVDVVGWVDDTLEQLIGIDIELQDWKLNLANPTGDLTLLDVAGWVDDQIEAVIGVDVELQDWKLGLANPSGDLTLADVIGWIDDQLEDIVGVNVELQDWKLKLGMPEVSLGFTRDDVVNALQDMLGLGDMEVPAPTIVSAGNTPVSSLPHRGGQPDTHGVDPYAGMFPDPLAAAQRNTETDYIVQSVRYESSPGEDFAAFVESVQSGADQTPIKATVEFDTAALSAAAVAVTSITLAIESRVTAMASTVTAMAVNTGDGFSNGMSPGLDQAVSHAGAVQMSLASIFGAIAIDGTNYGLLAGSGFSGAMIPGLDAGVAHAGAVQGSLASIGNGIATSLTLAGFNGGAGLAAGVWQGGSNAVAAAGSAAAGIRGAVSFDLYNEGYGIGSSLGLGIGRGIDAMAGAVAASAAAIVSAAVSSARGAGAIASPSKVMRDLVGRPLGEGVSVGILGEQGGVERAARSLVGAALVGVPGGASGGGGFGARPAAVTHVTNHFHGDVYDGEKFDDRVTTTFVDRIAPALGQAKAARDRSIGVRR